MSMTENYKHLYDQTKKMLTMYQDELIPGFRKTIAELEAKSKWIPVSEPPKEPGIYQVFGYDKGWEKTKVWYGQFSGYDWFVYNIYGDGMLFDITHWMPLPEAPKGE